MGGQRLEMENALEGIRRKHKIEILGFIFTPSSIIVAWR